MIHSDEAGHAPFKRCVLVQASDDTLYVAIFYLNFLHVAFVRNTFNKRTRFDQLRGPSVTNRSSDGRCWILLFLYFLRVSFPTTRVRLCRPRGPSVTNGSSVGRCWNLVASVFSAGQFPHQTMSALSTASPHKPRTGVSNFLM